MSDIIEWDAPSMQGGYPRTPESLPHGLITPPDLVRELVAKEKARLTPPGFDAAWEVRILNEWTIGYYFDYLGHEVIYRPTPAGPDVLAVGEEEIIRLKLSYPFEEQLKLETWMD